MDWSLYDNGLCHEIANLFGASLIQIKPVCDAFLDFLICSPSIFYLVSPSDPLQLRQNFNPSRSRLFLTNAKILWTHATHVKISTRATYTPKFYGPTPPTPFSRLTWQNFDRGHFCLSLNFLKFLLFRKV